MPEIELDDDKEELSNPKGKGPNNAEGSVLKSNAVSSIVPRERLQKLNACGQLCNKAPISEKAKILIKSGIQTINDTVLGTDFENKKADVAKLNPTSITSSQNQESNFFVDLSQSSSIRKFGAFLLGNISHNLNSIKTDSLNMLSECHDKFRQLVSNFNSIYLETKKFFYDLYKKAVTSFVELYNHAKEVVKDSLKFISKAFESKGSLKTAISLDPVSEIQHVKYENKAASSAQIQNSAASLSKDFQADESLGNKLKNIIETIAQAIGQKEQEKKFAHEQFIIQQQIKLSQEADRAYSEALLKRPDLASKLTRPQIAFAAGSPFAKLPSAEDLIEQAEKKPTIH